MIHVPFLSEKHDLNLISFSPALARVVGKCCAAGSEVPSKFGDLRPAPSVAASKMGGKKSNEDIYTARCKAHVSSQVSGGSIKAIPAKWGAGFCSLGRAGTRLSCSRQAENAPCKSRNPSLSFIHAGKFYPMYLLSGASVG